MFYKAAQAYVVNTKDKSKISTSEVEYWINFFILVQIVCLELIGKQRFFFLKRKMNLKDLFNAKLQASIFKK